MFHKIRRFLIGSPLPSWRSVHERLPKVLALPILASDNISSVAYATEEMLLILIIAGSMAVHSPLVLYLALAIVILQAIVVTSYRQTVKAYPSGGGAYTVAKENLGADAGLTAGAALIIDYTLTVAVSIAAGVAAIVSAYPVLAPYRVELALAGIAILALGNLRGVRESGLLFAMPTYVFLGAMFTLIAISVYRLNTVGLSISTAQTAIPPEASLGLFLVLRAFAGGCVAMTGTEAISNAVQAFRPPESKNAAATLVIMAAMLASMFIGVSYLAWQTHLVPLHPDTTGYETVVSQIARGTFGNSWFYFLVQYATAIILLLAANTSFAGFPRLASVMARDRYLPRQLFNVGDRLVFNNGILLLAALAAVLVVVFGGDTHSLIPLYSVGVFLSFTLSQTGIARRSTRLREAGWRRTTAISSVGAMATGIVTVVLTVTKFVEGAWIVVFLITGFVIAFRKIHDHYISVGDQLRLTPEDEFNPTNHTVIVLTPSLHRGVLQALEYAKGLSADVRALHVETDPLDTALLRERWERWGGGIPLVILESPYRSLVGPVLDYLEEAKRERDDDMITVVVPEFVPAKWWHKLLHNQSGFLLKFALLFRKDLTTTNIRYYLEK